MSEGLPYADIFILALIAGFILLRLRSVLGQRGDDDASRFFHRETAALPPSEPIVQLNEKSLKPKAKDDKDAYLLTLTDQDIIDTIAAIRAKDPTFTPSEFLAGARMAFEMVFDAFAKSDKQTLKMLLSEDRFKEFGGEIDARDKEPNVRETTLVSVKAKDITHASMTGNTARLSVSFESEQVTVVRDADGKIVEGDASEVDHVADQWTFERDVTSRNPNWKIVET